MVRFGLIASACFATLASLGFAGVARGFTVSPGPATDAEFNNLLTSGYIREVYVPGARGGNSGNNSLTTAERELEILDPLDVNLLMDTLERLLEVAKFLWLLAKTFGGMVPLITSRLSTTPLPSRGHPKLPSHWVVLL
jgi:hypothetical protein